MHHENDDYPSTVYIYQYENAWWCAIQVYINMRMMMCYICTCIQVYISISWEGAEVVIFWNGVVIFWNWNGGQGVEIFWLNFQELYYACVIKSVYVQSTTCNFKFAWTMKFSYEKNWFTKISNLRIKHGGYYNREY